MEKLLRKFDELSDQRNVRLFTGSYTRDIWYQTYSVLLMIIEEGRKKDRGFAAELYEPDEYQCDVTGWLDDYLDELDMHGEYNKLLQTCRELLDLFKWEEDTLDLRFRTASVLGALGKTEEALSYCEDWYQAEGDNIQAAAALIYARIRVKDFEGAQQIVDLYIPEEAVCTEENDIICTTAQRLYKESGNRKAERKLNQAVKKYEKEMEEAFFDMDDDDMDFGYF